MSGGAAVEQASGSKADRDRSRSGSDEHHEVAVQASASAEQLPVDSLKEAAAHLRRPFTAEAIRFKVQSFVGGKANPRGGIVVAYIDARLVVERLNAVCPHLWFDVYDQLDARHMRCRLTVDTVTRQDVGEAQGLSKDLFSDALKRAAVKFGVGVSVYALPQVYLPVGEKGLEVTGGEGKKSLRIPDGTLARLRGGYEKWLEGPGRHFGMPLNHGDTLEPIAGETFEDTEVEEESPAVQGEEADALREDIRTAFDRLCEIDGQAMTPAEYGRRRASAEHSVEGLRALYELLSGMVDERQGVAA